MFSINYNPIGNSESCDVCGKKDSEPSLFIEQRSREGCSVLWVHERCLQRRIALAITKATKEAANV